MAFATALELLQKLLVFHPGRRATVDEALANPYLQDLHDPDDEVRATDADLLCIC